MTNARASAAQILRRAARAARALRDDARASAAVEAALILPIALTMFALLIYGAEAFAIQRKVTLTARTVTDLVTQAAPTQMSSGASVVVHATIDNLLCASKAVVQPYNSNNMSMVVSQVKVNSDGATSADGLTALVTWSEPYNGATARALNQKITLPTGLGVGQAGNYLVLGEVYYNFTPLSLFTPAAAMTLHDAIYLTPRQSTSITCTDCATHS
jgi:Flp pilus assembly protein TadG